MYTLDYIHRLLSDYAQQQEWLTGATKEEYEAQKQELRQRIIRGFEHLRISMPNLVQINIKDKCTKQYADEFFAALRKAVANQYSVAMLPNGAEFQDNIFGDSFVTPALTNWHKGTKAHNFLINYTASTHAHATQRLHNLLLNMMLALPVKALHLNFVDMNYIGDAAFFTKNLDKRLYRDLIVSGAGMRELLDDMSARMVNIFQDYGDIVTYNEEKKRINIPYEVIVLTGYPDKYSPYVQDLEPLIQNGYKGGIYFIVMNDTDYQPLSSDEKDKLLTRNTDLFQTINAEPIKASSPKAIVRHTPISLNAEMCRYAFEYLNESANHVVQISSEYDYNTLLKQQYAQTDDAIEVPIGVAADGTQIHFCLNTTDHVHAFIMGQSGSGKSVLLHSILRATVSKYAPADMQLYLLDFKLGGVEFNAYKDMRHVKALLVDNTDQHITLEIMRDISNQMKERGNLFRKAAVQDIGGYNRANPGNRLPQILLVVDECHELFRRERGNNAEAEEISKIVAKIAKEGRSQGVHFIMATQTMAETDISTDILRNITDHYLLRTSEGFRGVPDSSTNITPGLATGQVYYHHVNEVITFQTYYTQPAVAERVMTDAANKARQSKGNGQFYFSGSQKYFVDHDVLRHLSSAKSKYPTASIGRTLSLASKPVDVTFKRDDGQNMLLFGINDEHQVSESTVAAITTLTAGTCANGLGTTYYVIDCLYDDNEPPQAYRRQLQALADTGAITLVSGRECGAVLERLATDIKEQSAQPAILAIIGQEKFRALKIDKEIEGDDTPLPEPAATASSDTFESLLSGLTSFGTQSSVSGNSGFKTYRKALAYILDNGPAAGVHVIMQISKPGLLLFEDNFGSKHTRARFSHIVMFRTDERDAGTLVDDNIHIERLSADPERPRAYYYNDVVDSYTMFIPYKV